MNRLAATTQSRIQSHGVSSDGSYHHTPASSPSVSVAAVPITNLRDLDGTTARMEAEKQKEEPVAVSGTPDRAPVDPDSKADPAAESRADDAVPAAPKKQTCRRSKHKAKKAKVTRSKKTRKSEAVTSDSSSDEEDDSDSSSSEDDSDSDSSDDDHRSKRKAKKARAKARAKKSRSKKKRSAEEEEDSSDSSDRDDSSSEEESSRRRKKRSKKSKRASTEEDEESGDGSAADDVEETSFDSLQAQLDALRLQAMQQKTAKALGRKRRGSGAKSKPKSKKQARGTFRRVDEVWDTTIHDYKLRDSNKSDESDYDDYAWLVRRCFNWENKPSGTVVDIKSQQLRAVLLAVMKDCKSVALEAKEPVIDPNILFLYLEDLRAYAKTLRKQIRAERKRKVVKKLTQQRRLCKAMVAYIDEDYADTKKTLYPLLKAGNITFDLLWALFKPNEIAVTSTYGMWEEPRCFKVDYANKSCSLTRGEWYCVEGRYLEYDGKSYGFGDFEADVDAFKGPRKIASLAVYPLRYHKDPEGLRQRLVKRGEMFVRMEGMQYKFHEGLAFMKKKKQVLKISTNSRIMVDPSCFRRINPNYPISFIKPKEAEELFDEDEDEDCSCCDSDLDDAAGGNEQLDAKADDFDGTPKYKYKWAKDERGEEVYVAVEVDENGDPIRGERLHGTEVVGASNQNFTADELLLTSSVVLGFAFSEKLWLEFTIAGLKEIEWNEHAFDSLVLPPNQKEIVRALVESHKFSAAKTIDDVIQGKGRGLVSVLHGPPGTGKTLTAEGISELLKCPLYMVSAGELGTDPAKLEFELQKILDIAHSWGAVLLLDEADVFLEKRETHDIHRNALVSIFLRLLEYFQGILFLTTNRVETFDDAFASRIHVALRYGNLTHKAKKAVWSMFLELVRKSDATQIEHFADEDLEALARHELNGRQIKNTVRTAQALALNERAVMRMSHVKRVLDVSEAFDRDLKGGTGYEDAMRSYT
nr:hypothetical protein CFP56_16628 [Quercus suber]